MNVLGIRRKKEYLLQDLGNERIHSGDVLLVQGTWNNIARLSKEDSDWVVLGQPLAEAAKVTLDYKAPVAAAIMVLMVVMMVFDFYSGCSGYSRYDSGYIDGINRMFP